MAVLPFAVPIAFAAALATASVVSPADTVPPIRNVVLVHGAFADGSSYSKVISLLMARGYHVTAVQNPLTSLADDAAATQRAIAMQDGPVILVGHSWASCRAKARVRNTGPVELQGARRKDHDRGVENETVVVRRRGERPHDIARVTRGLRQSTSAHD